MLKRKRLISMGLTVLLVSAYSSGAYTSSVNALEMTKQAKMSEVLLAEMDKASKHEKVPVAIELEDINQDEIEKKVDKQTGMSVKSLEALESNLLNSKELQNASNEELDGMLPSYFADTKENREYIQGLVNERISTKRKISKQMYTKKNVERIEKLGIEESDLEFVSSYSPMIIGEMTESEVEDIIINSNVKSIDYDADVEISAEDVEMNTNAASTVAAASSTPSQQDLYVNIWKSAVNVDYTINTLGLKGEGINVGLQDIDSVTGNHGELKDTNITVIDKIANYDGDHGDFCTRILAGSNGIVSKANIYTNNIANGSFTGIEELIDQGVSIISISIAYNFKTGPQYYSYIEQWYDYICKNSGVVIVTAAGNVTEKYGDIVSQGGLSYNVITVGGIDVKNTFDKAKHTFWNGTCTVNGGNSGCAKPDVEAPATGVFGSGGTSGATPIVAGICAQIIEAKPTLAFHPEIVKAIILASCDRKGKGGESYTDGLTAKEGSGVVNAQIAVTIASATRYISGTWSKSNDGVGRTVYLPKKSDYTKIVLAWMVPAVTTNTKEISNFKFKVSSNDTGTYKETNLPNSSAEMIVSNEFKYVTNFTLTRMDTDTSSVSYAIAWY